MGPTTECSATITTSRNLAGRVCGWGRLSPRRGLELHDHGYDALRGDGIAGNPTGSRYVNTYYHTIQVNHGTAALVSIQGRIVLDDQREVKASVADD